MLDENNSDCYIVEAFWYSFFSFSPSVFLDLFLILSCTTFLSILVFAKMNILKVVAIAYSRLVTKHCELHSLSNIVRQQDDYRQQDSFHKLITYTNRTLQLTCVEPIGSIIMYVFCQYLKVIHVITRLQLSPSYFIP